MTALLADGRAAGCRVRGIRPHGRGGAAGAPRRRPVACPGTWPSSGFDDAPVCRHTDPELTTVAQPVEEMGAVMAGLLIDRIAGRDVPGRTVLPTRLVVRAST